MRWLAALLLLAACTRQPEIALTNTSITLPDDTVAFPVRAGSDAMTANCAACHSAEMILTQPRLTTAEWQAEIKKMKAVYKAPVDPADETAILAYLEATSAALPLPGVAPAP